MKKNFLVVLMLVLFSTFCMTACNLSSSIDGKFKQSQYFISLDEVIDFYDEFTVKGISKDKIVFSSSNEEILAVDEENNFYGLSSGKTFVFANFDKKVIAKSQVYVKHKLKAPQNIYVDDSNGIVSWDKSYVIAEGNKIEATNYQISLNQVGNEDINNFTTDKTSFQLSQVGSYQLKIVADSVSEKVDPSDEKLYTINYGVMSWAGNTFKFAVEKDFNQKGIISWDKVENACYDIYIDGIKMASDTVKNSFEIDLNKYDSARDITVEVVMKDISNIKAPSSKLTTVTILESPEIAYSFDGLNGMLNSQYNQDACGFLLEVENLETGEKSESYFDKVDDLFVDNISGFEKGIYNVRIIAVGGEKNGKFYVNSKFSNIIKFGKLQLPKPAVDFVEDKIIVNFNADSYVTRYKISCGDESFIFDTEESGLECEINLNNLNIGNYDLIVTALPSLNGEDVKELVVGGGIASSNVVNSDDFIFNFFKLAEIGDIKHSIISSKSYFEFDKVENANTYFVFLEDQLIDYEIGYNGNKVVASVDTEILKEFEPIDNKYNFKVVAQFTGEKDGLQHSFLSIKTKSLEILNVVEEIEQQKNGSFEWNALDKDCGYYYKIYKTDESFDITGLQPLIEKEVLANKIEEILEEGYYNIKITTISKNTDRYLDSDFYNENNIFEKNFHVTKKIDSPTVKVDQTDGLALKISAVEFGGEYQVYIDGKLDGSIIINEISDEIIYKIKDSLSQTGDYQISVVVGGGNLYDNNIYLNSDPSEIVVTRLSQPNQNVTDIYSDIEELLGQKLEVERLEGARAVKFSLDGETLLETDKFNLDILDKTKFGSEFTLGITLLAEDGIGNHFFIDSIEKEIVFNRVNAPTSIDYNDGYVTWQNDDKRVQNYYFSIILENSKTSNYYYRFTTSTLNNRLNLQSNIDALCKTDIAFLTAYRQAEKIKVDMIAYRNGFSGNVYLLPSFGGNEKELKHLEKVSVTFNPNSKILSWDNLIQETVFDIYLDDETSPLVADFKRNEYDFSKMLELFAQQRKITVLAKNSRYLSSERSEAIFIKQLTSPKTLSIEKNGDEDRVSFAIINDSAYVSEVLVNGSKENVNYIQGENKASFNPKNFDSENFVIVLKAKNESQKNFYIDSNEISYTLIDLSSCELNANLSSNSLGWARLASDMIGNNIDPIAYEIKVTNDGKSKVITLQNEVVIFLDKIEEIFGMTLNGNFQIEVKAKVDKVYTISHSENVRGYYGESNVDIVNSHKLQQADGLEYKIEDGNVLNQIESKTTSSLIISFNDKWSDYVGIEFDVTLRSENGNYVFSPVVGFNSPNYQFNLNDGKYVLKVSSEILKQFDGGNIDIFIKAKKDKFASSEEATMTVFRYYLVDDVEITDEGLLIINDDQNASYLIEISIGNDIFEVELKDDKALNLTIEDLILNKKGAFTVKIIAYDLNNNNLSSQKAMVYNGYKLEGIESIDIDDEGYINFTLYNDDLSDLTFVAERDEQKYQFNPERDIFVSNKFYISMLDMLKIFDSDLSMQEGIADIAFSVKKTGSIESSSVGIEFDFAIEKTQPDFIKSQQNEKDYILFDMLESGKETLSFRVSFTAQNMIEGINKNTIVKVVKASDVLGYWISDESGNNGEFSILPPTQSGLKSRQVYALNLSTLLQEVDYGNVEIEVSRIAVGERHIQYRSTKFVVNKLNSVNNDQTLHVLNSNLNFTWTSLDESVNANSFMVYFERNGSVLKVSTPVSSLDLRNIGLVSGEVYNIYITAHSSDKYQIASNRSLVECQTIQFTKPTSLEVKNGILQYNQNVFENSQFIQDINNYFGQLNPAVIYHEDIGDKEYKDIIYFTPAYLERFDITLRFNRVEDGKLTNKIYNLTTKAYNLLPDLKIKVLNSAYTEYLGGDAALSYFELLNIYKTKNLQGNEGVKAGNVRLMIDALSKSTKGIGDGGYLFDDSGRDIPAGEYFVSIFQNSYQQFVESQNSDGVRMYLSPAPKINLSAEEVEGKINYFANVQLASTMILGDEGYQENFAQRYKLQLRKSGEIASSLANVIEFLIETDGEGWILSYKGNVLEDVVLIQEEGKPNFKINMTVLRKSLLELGEEVIAINELYQADLFVYNQDNGFVINGKSGVFNLRYLDLRADDIHFENGQFIVETNSEGFELLLRYKRPATVEQSKTIRFTNGRAVIDLRETGEYQYIMLSLSGSHSSSVLNIESASYKILDVYKLTAPTLSVSNGSLSIGYSRKDGQSCGELHFNLGNNISLAEDYEGEDKDYYYQSLIMSNQNIPLYIVGSLDENGNVKFESELLANQFVAYLRGNNGSFISNENEDKTSDFILSFESGQRPMLSSSETILNARMLEEVDGIEIQKGDIKIVDDSNIEIFDSEKQNGSILYELTIDYYYKDNLIQNKYIYARSEKLYCEKADGEIIEKYISGQIIKSDYSYYTFTVVMVPAKSFVENDSGDKVTTIEGKDFILSEALTFEDGAYVLRSVDKAIPTIVSRTNSAKLATRSNGITNGMINFIIDRSVYYSSNPENIALDSAKRISIYADYIANGRDKTVQLKGEYSFSTSTVSGEENNVYVSFLPDDGQLNDASGSIKLRIYVYGIDEIGNSAIMSNPLVIDDVYKLDKIDERYYSVILVNGQTGIDFSKYFSAVSIQDNRDCYKIVVDYSTTDGEDSLILTNKSSSKVMLIPDNLLSISFQARDAQSGQEINIKKLLSSDIENLSVNKTSIDELEIKFNEQLKRFEWEWPEDNQNQYQYYINLYISGVNETVFASDNFYCPRNTGVIYPKAFKIKAREIGNEGSSISIFSEEKIFDNQNNIECKLFTAGNGSQSNPYQIANANDFANIKLRNTNDFYFKLISDIEIDSAENNLAMEDFYGHLNGNGYKIIFTSTSVNEIEEVSQYLIGFDNLTFNSYSSLFKSVALNAEINNLNISHNINYTSLNSSKIIFAPVCLYNFGKIENVKVSDFNIVLSDKNSSVGNNIFIGGIAGYNYGLIDNCRNETEFDYIMPQSLSINFAYAGISIFNSSHEGNVGIISNCFNIGNKRISVAVGSNKFYMSGITLSNVGKISMCGNDGNLNIATRTTTVSSITCYFAGIAITSTNGTLEYLYNNGKISSETIRGEFIYSGIVYQIMGGSINTLVETQAGQPITRSCQANTIDYGNHYASNNSGTAINIQVNMLTETTLPCSDTKSLSIQKTADGYRAKIINN